MFDVTPIDLATYLGRGDIDDDRAYLMLRLARGLCETVVTPLPDGAEAIVLAVAARAFTNVTSAHQVGIGSAQVSYGAQNSSTGVGGLYLSRSDIAALRRASGGGGAFTIDPTGADAGIGLEVWNQNAYWPDGIPTLGEPR